MFNKFKRLHKLIDVKVIEVPIDSVEKLLYVVVKSDNGYKCIIVRGTNKGNTQGV